MMAKIVLRNPFLNPDAKDAIKARTMTISR
jgi:hypothetical protein